MHNGREIPSSDFDRMQFTEQLGHPRSGYQGPPPRGPLLCHKAVTRIHSLYTIRQADPMRRLATAALTAGLLIALAACSNEPAAPTVSKTSSSPEPAATTSTPAPTPTDTTYKFSETAKVNDDPNGVVFTVTVIAYTQPVKGPQPPDPAIQGGNIWATVEAKICNEAKTVTVSQFPWSLAYTDGTIVKVTGSSGGDMPKPEFPMDAPIKAGRCVKGKIPFPVMSNSRPERIVYAPESLSAEPVEWAVPKA